MKFHTCSKCGHSYSLFENPHLPITGTLVEKELYTHIDRYETRHNCINILYLICPNTECKQIDVFLNTDEELGSITKWIIPISNAKTYPNINPII